ncbi:MAG: hypothetical protein ACI4GW_01980 [Lachnospiraceae bacterium]
MNLCLVYKDGHAEIVEDVYLLYHSSISICIPDSLYIETVKDDFGKGCFVPLSDLLTWSICLEVSREEINKRISGKELEKGV